MKIKVALAWHNPNSGNLGCSALAISNCVLVHTALSRIFDDLEIVLFGDQPESDMDGSGFLEEYIGKKLRYEVVSLRTLATNPFSLLSTFKGFDYVFDISAGDSFSDIYGWKRLLTQSFFKYLAARRSRLILCPQTIGPFNGSLSRVIAKKILKETKIIFTRDPVSTRIVESLSDNSVIYETTDVAFSLPYTTAEKHKDKKVAGINVSGLLAAGGYSQDNQFGIKSNYLSTIGDVICLLKKNNYELVLVPHVLSSEQMSLEDDLYISKAVSEKYSVRISPAFKSPVEAKNYISGLDLFVGSRMHATIGALSCGVPVIPLAYSLKFSPLFSALKYPHTINLKTTLSEVICSEIQDKITKIEEVKVCAEGASRLAKMENAKYVEVLERFIRSEIERALEK